MRQPPSMRKRKANQGKVMQRQFAKGPCWERLAGWTAPGPWTLAPTHTRVPCRGSQNALDAADWRCRDCQGRNIPLGRSGQKSAHKPMAGSRLREWTLRGLQTRALGQQQPQGGLAVILAHGGVEVGGGQKLRMGLMRAPLHEEAVADAPEQTRHEQGVRVANPATL